MKQLNITKEQFIASKYFPKKYGTLKYVSKSGRFYKTSKGVLLRFTKGEDEQFDVNGNGCLVEFTGNNNIAERGEITIPDTIDGKVVTSIGEGAFFGCTGITVVTIPDSVESIEDYAFCGCTSLTKIQGPEKTNDNGQGTNHNLLGLKKIGEYAFYNCSGLIAGPYATNPLSLGDCAYKGCNSLAGSGSNGFVVIRDNLFDYVPTGTTPLAVTIPNNVVKISPKAFYNCQKISKITWPTDDKLKSIGSYAFYGCSKWGETDATARTLSIPNTVEEIGDHAFAQCTNIRTLVIPEDSIETIEDGTFSNCTLLNSVTISEGVKSIGNMAFYDCRSITSITIPDSVQTIGECAFHNCSLMETLTLGSGLKKIGYGAFWDCSKITQVTIPASVTSIGKLAFANCDSLTKVIIQGNPEIAENAFDDDAIIEYTSI